MRPTSALACAGLLTGALVALSGTTAHAAPARHESESSPAVCTGTIDSNWSGFSVSGFCNGTNATGAYLQFTVSAAAAGTATLGIRFANGTTANRPANLVVNGSTVTSLAFERTGAWNAWVTRTVSVPVTAGSNTIRLTPTTPAGLPNVDHLDAEVGTTQPPMNTIYVATNGNDGNAGTLSEPLRSCTAWDNPGTGFNVSRSSSTLTRNLAVANGTNVSMGSNSTGSGNSWNIGGGWPLVSTDPGAITGPRAADGSIPSSTFLRPANGADVGARF